MAEHSGERAVRESGCLCKDLSRHSPSGSLRHSPVSSTAKLGSQRSSSPTRRDVLTFIQTVHCGGQELIRVRVTVLGVPLARGLRVGHLITQGEWIPCILSCRPISRGCSPLRREFRATPHRTQGLPVSSRVGCLFSRDGTPSWAFSSGTAKAAEEPHDRRLCSGYLDYRETR